MKKRRLEELLSRQVLVMDGAMGTMLHAKGLSPGECPELWNLTHKNLVQEIHRAYLDAGAVILDTNTFGGNIFKLREYGLGDKVYEINYAGVRLAKEVAGERLVAASMGPTGKFLEPMGNYSFDDFYQAFKDQALAFAAAGADLVSIETMSDIGEMRAAVIAVLENTDLPVIAQMTFQEGGRTLTGSDPRTAAVVLDSLGVTALGANCSGGPRELLAVLEEMAEVTSVPLVVQPNAGLPQLEGGVTRFSTLPEEMAEIAVRMVEAGACIIGGCCGTNPDYIRAIASRLKGLTPRRRKPSGLSYLAGRTKTVIIGGGVPAYIGERINPTSRQDITADICSGTMMRLVAEAESQVGVGAPILDVNVGVPGINEPAAMKEAVLQIQGAVDTVLSIDSSNPLALEAGLKAFSGKPLVNSVNGKEASLERVLPLVKKYGAAVIALTLDEKGIPADAEERLRIAEKIVTRAEAISIKKEDIFVDTLVVTAGAQQHQVMETLRAIPLIKSRLGVKTALGITNVGHGLPNPELLSITYLAMALGYGLDLPFINPFHETMRHMVTAGLVLTGRDAYANNYIQSFRGKQMPGGELTTMAKESISLGIEEQIASKVIRGAKGEIGDLVTKALAEGKDPLALINRGLIPGIEEVGRKYQERVFFLPQLMLAAETVKEAFHIIKPQLLKSGQQVCRGKIVLATVKGDIHDIGKNIVGVMLENYGFEVIDLGKDVAAEKIIEVTAAEQADLIGLSALMTTTMPAMADVINQVKAAGLPAKVMVGGAVVTEAYAREIGADGYAKDARAAVEQAEELMSLAK